MASKEQIQRAIQAANNAGAASGYASALQDVVTNLAAQADRWRVEIHEPGSIDLVTSIERIHTTEAFVSNIDPELERRKTLATQTQQAAQALAVVALSDPGWKVSIARRAIDALGLRPLLVQALGGAVSRRPAT